eukprot:SAG25_NODE_562_length_6909_cov_2.841557_5_plen_162_part_00
MGGERSRIPRSKRQRRRLTSATSCCSAQDDHAGELEDPSEAEKYNTSNLGRQISGNDGENHGRPRRSTDATIQLTRQYTRLRSPDNHCVCFSGVRLTKTYSVKRMLAGNFRIIDRDNVFAMRQKELLKAQQMFQLSASAAAAVMKKFRWDQKKAQAKFRQW